MFGAMRKKQTWFAGSRPYWSSSIIRRIFGLLWSFVNVHSSSAFLRRCKIRRLLRDANIVFPRIWTCTVQVIRLRCNNYPLLNRGVEPVKKVNSYFTNTNAFQIICFYFYNSVVSIIQDDFIWNKSCNHTIIILENLTNLNSDTKIVGGRIQYWVLLNLLIAVGVAAYYLLACFSQIMGN